MKLAFFFIKIDFAIAIQISRQIYEEICSMEKIKKSV